MKYSKNSKMLGLGRLERERLSILLESISTTITVTEADGIWKLGRAQTAKLLSWYCKKGWLRRIARGVYIPVPLESRTVDVIPDEPLAIAEKLFSPCYIGGSSAVSYWDLTEQIFHTVTVMTKKRITKNTQEIAGIEYLIHTLNSRYFFGLKTVWLGGVKTQISDPTRTLVDMLMFPQFCEGIQFFEDVFKNYMKSEYKDLELLESYLTKAKNGAAIKRFGFLFEVNFPNENKFLKYCANNLTQGYVKLSPPLNCKHLITRWRLWVPDSWREKLDDQ